MLCGSLDGRRAWGRMDTGMQMAESSRCPPETITALWTGCTSIQNKKLKENSFWTTLKIHLRKRDSIREFFHSQLSFEFLISQVNSLSPMYFGDHFLQTSFFLIQFGNGGGVGCLLFFIVLPLFSRDVLIKKKIRSSHTYSLFSLQI